jgi:hypothetical protein
VEGGGSAACSLSCGAIGEDDGDGVGGFLDVDAKRRETSEMGTLCGRVKVEVEACAGVCTPRRQTEIPRRGIKVPLDPVSKTERTGGGGIRLR